MSGGRSDQLGADEVSLALRPTVFLRPIGSSMPLGFLGLAVATMALGGLELGWIPTGQAHQVAWVLIVFAFPVQAISCVFGYLARDTVVGAGFGLQAAAWLTVGVLTLTSPPGARSLAVGLFLFVAAAGLIPSVLTASLSKGVVGGVLSLTVLRWVLTGIYERLGTDAWKVAAGWEGLALCVAALYAAMALELEDQRGRTLLPTLRRGRGRQAIDDGFDTDTDRARHEAGVRNQL